MYRLKTSPTSKRQHGKGKRFKLVDFILAIVLLAAATLYSCGGNQNNGLPTPGNSGDATFSVSIKENFSKNPLKNLNNIQVGDTLRYDIDLKDLNNESNIHYSIDLHSKDGEFHRRIGKDYRVFIFRRDSLDKHLSANPNFLKENEEWMKDGEIRQSLVDLPGNKEYVLLIIPIQPGTFQLSYTFLKPRGKQKPMETVDKQINFNCVHLSAWYKSIKTKDGSGGFIGIGGHASEHHNEFYFKIDDGSNEKDKFLASIPNRSQEYTLMYNGKKYGNDFFEGQEICFLKGKTTKKHAPEVTVRVIEEITILQKDEGRDEVVLKFYNIPLEQK